MKLLLYSLAITLFFASCGTGGKNESSGNTADTAATQETAGVASNASVKPILDAYFSLKNALAQDNDQNAAAAGKQLAATMGGLDKSTLNKEQAAVFTDIYEDAKEHGEHIAGNAGNIAHQREHFETLSEEMAELAKVSPGGKMYIDHCPMFNDGKGANWLSESKEISNPYLGKAMPTCGTVKEEIN